MPLWAFSSFPAGTRVRAAAGEIHNRSGLRSPDLASSMICLTTTSLARPLWSLSPSATRAISNGEFHDPLGLGVEADAAEKWCDGHQRPSSQADARPGLHHRPAGLAGGDGVLGAVFRARRSGT